MALDLTPQQVAVLERLRDSGYTLVAFPMYAQHVGVRRGDCAALLAPAGERMKIYGEACWLVNGNMSVRVRRPESSGAREWFVWKKQQVEATGERLAELKSFRAELERALL